MRALDALEKNKYVHHTTALHRLHPYSYYRAAKRQLERESERGAELRGSLACAQQGEQNHGGFVRCFQ